MVGTIAIIVSFGERLLPYRNTQVISPDLSAYARTLMQQYALTGGLFRLEVQPRSPWIGIAPAALDLRRYASVTLVGAKAGGTKDPANEVAVLAVRSASIEEADDRLFTPPERGVAEIIIPPRSPLI